MKLTNDWYYFNNTLSSDICNKIIEEGKASFEDARCNANGPNEKSENPQKYRKTDVQFLDEKWIYDLVFPICNAANEQAGWNFDITACEASQLGKYKNSDLYEWHTDGPSDTMGVYIKPENKLMDGNVRKLSMSILLNDEFEGGEFQFSTLCPKGDNVIISTPKEFGGIGSVIVFPSFLTHRVKKVTSGIRYSLVTWFLGPPFK